MVLTCFLCKKTFEDHESMPECLVGGHWTPHSTEDRPTGIYSVCCCHQFQKEVLEENL